MDFFNLLTGPELLEVTEAHLPAHRSRLYPPTVMLSMFMQQALNADGSCQKAINGWAAQRAAEGLGVQTRAHWRVLSGPATLAGADGDSADARHGPSAERTSENRLALAWSHDQAGGRYRNLDAGYAGEPGVLSAAEQSS
jgi:hypothetical protein